MKTILAGEVLDSDHLRQRIFCTAVSFAHIYINSDLCFLVMNVRQDSNVCCLTKVLNPKTCNELITPPEESYRLWCVVVCELETS
jgi:hypothetical protein